MLTEHLYYKYHFRQPENLNKHIIALLFQLVIAKFALNKLVNFLNATETVSSRLPETFRRLPRLRLAMTV